MPTLDWIGKDKVVNHHLDVPYRVLKRVYSYSSLDVPPLRNEICATTSVNARSDTRGSNMFYRAVP